MVESSRAKKSPTGTRRSRVGPILAAWLLSLGIDFFLHGGLLARIYVHETPFLLSASEAFARIPLGYLAFLALTVALWWLLTRLGVRTGREGLRIGAASGVVVWGALVIGLYSISSAPTELLLGWWAGQSAELAVAGLVMGATLGEAPRSRIYQRVLGATILFVIGTVILQVVGWAPPMEIAASTA